MKLKKVLEGLIIFWFLAMIVFVVWVLGGCTPATVGQTLKTETLYQKDMIITANGVTEEGVLVVPMKAENTVHVIARGDLDMFVMSNCAGEWKKEKAWNVTQTVRSGLFGWGSKKIDKTREVEFKYYPSGLERLGSCPLQLTGFSKDGKHSWGFIDFKTDTFTLKANMVCNGVKMLFDGVIACQTRAGLYQVVTFEEPVRMSPDPGCELDKTSGKEFTFPMPAGECVYRIEAEADPSRLGKMTLFGYDGILVRQ